MSNLSSTRTLKAAVVSLIQVDVSTAFVTTVAVSSTWLPGVGIKVKYFQSLALSSWPCPISRGLAWKTYPNDDATDLRLVILKKKEEKRRIERRR